MKIQEQESYTAIGIMSGTSVDGLDLALCRFSVSEGNWLTEIIKTKTIPYDGTQWTGRLSGANHLSGFQLMELHRDFGRFTGTSVKIFLENADCKVDLIASHGHTVFHQPDKGITLQIGDGAEIASVTGIITVSDFRRLDMALGGQGAPLVPAGDELLFGQYSHCLNLGGIANVSFRKNGRRLAYDICPVNIVLNRLAQFLGYGYDNNGELAGKGHVDRGLLHSLENLPFYRLHGPRSLGREWVDEIFMPVLEKYDIGIEHKLRTVCEHIALRIAAAVASPAPHVTVITENNNKPYGHQDEFMGSVPDQPASLLVTGGGARNGFLVKLITEKAENIYTVIPDQQLIDFKEAIVFAFLGVLRMRNQANCLSSVTGARSDNSGGIIHAVTYEK
jgi:anhydro-N-acetylmuramic acid kinase